MSNQKSTYDLVCDIEEANLNRRFLPYSVGSPSKNVTYNDQHTRANFLFFTDSHVDLFFPEESMDNVKRTVEYANNCPVKLDALINAGDAITPWNMVPKENAMGRAKSFFEEVKKSKCPVIYSIGNHDLNDSENICENVIEDADWGKLFFDYAQEHYGIVRQIKSDGQKSTWHYYDVEAKKIRIISLYAMDTDRSVKDDRGMVKYFSKYGAFMTSEQLNWLASTALNFDDKEEQDWGVIITFHMFPENFGYHQNSGEMLHKICVAFNTQGTYSFNCKDENNSHFDLDITADFTRYAQNEKKPHMICWLLGHDHEDKNEVRDGINIIWSLNGSASCEYGDARVARYPGTSTQNSFDIVNVDTLNRKIRLFRYGAGLNCYGVGGDRFLPDGLDY